MKVNEMTNEELANELLVTVGLDSPDCRCDRCVAVREAAARLRNVTVRTDNSKVIAELQRRLKVADDALETIYKCIDNRRGVDVSMLVKSIIADALDEIRKEGGAK